MLAPLNELRQEYGIACTPGELAEKRLRGTWGGRAYLR